MMEVTMSVTELFPLVESLPSAEKFQLLQFLVAELGKEAGLVPLNSHSIYEVWTPYDVPDETVTKLANMLAEERASYDA
jgi:hypothetical protein